MNGKENSVSEAAMRVPGIEHRLAVRGWELVSFSKDAPTSSYTRHAVRKYPTDNGLIDYALFVDGRLLGIVEAKTFSLDSGSILLQAESYARGARDTSFNFRGLRVPFLYASNGEHTWFHDVRSAAERSREIFDFHAPVALVEMLAGDLDAACAKLATTPNGHAHLRRYQQEANRAVEQGIAAHKRHMLVVMAPGTGKTFTVINLIRRLFEAGVVRRVLFLVDRRAIAEQTLNTFANFGVTESLKFDEMYEVFLQLSSGRKNREGGEDSKSKTRLPSELTSGTAHAFVRISTIQSMVMELFGDHGPFGKSFSGESDDAKRLDRLTLPIHAFDLVIADECLPRSTSAQPSGWRATLDYFDAIKIGLTATPDRHTVAYFKDVMYRYSQEQAVRDGYLVDCEVVSILSGARVNGAFLQSGEAARVTDAESRRQRFDRMEDEREYDIAEIERKVATPSKNRAILEEIRRHALAHEARFGRFPKTLIFAVDVSHADHLVMLAHEVFGRDTGFVQKIAGDVHDSLQRIRDFRDNAAQPAVVITVDMLLSGMQFPDLEFIVLLRPVKSRIVFSQMIGLGGLKSRRFLDKSHFTVFDCFGGSLVKYFANSIEATLERASEYVRENRVRPDANWIALRAVRAILDAAEPFDVTIEGTTIRVDPQRLPAEPWPVNTWGLDESQDGPWPQSVLFDCSWAGGKTQIVASAMRAGGKRRDLVSVLFVARLTSQQLLWINVAAWLREGAEQAVPFEAWFSISTRIPDDPGEKQRRAYRILGIKSLVQRSSLPCSSGSSSVDAFSIALASGTVLPSPGVALRRLAHLALLKLPFWVKRQAEVIDGTPYINPDDVGSYMPEARTSSERIVDSDVNEVGSDAAATDPGTGKQEEPDTVLSPAVTAARWLDERLDLALENVLPFVAEHHLEVTETLIAQICAAAASGKHLLFVGPPGTGKTELAHALAAGARAAGYCSGVLAATASADWSTFDTIGGYAIDKDGHFAFRSGVFLRAVEQRKWLLIDEINRADIDRCFGELMTVLAGGRTDTSFTRMNDAAISIGPASGESHSVPSTFRVLATMNSWDKTSLFNLSYAVQRRFAAIYVGPPSDAAYAHIIDLQAIAVPDAAPPLEATAIKCMKHLFRKDGLLSCRAIGPAIAEDMVRYQRHRQASGDGFAEAVALFLLPQIEGLDAASVKGIFDLLQSALHGWASDDAMANLRERFRELFPAAVLSEL